MIKKRVILARAFRGNKKVFFLFNYLYFKLVMHPMKKSHRKKNIYGNKYTVTDIVYLRPERDGNRNKIDTDTGMRLTLFCRNCEI